VTANDSTAPYCTFPSMLASRLGMSYSISTLLLRNLGDVFGENDAARRRAALDELWNEDGVFYDPRRGAYRGRDEIDRIAGAIKATHPDFHYQPISEPEELGNGGRVKMGSGPLRCAAVLRRNRFPYRPRRPRRRSLPLFRQATLSWTLQPTNDERLSATWAVRQLTKNLYCTL
jgi:hypothetical protein